MKSKLRSERHPSQWFRNFLTWESLDFNFQYLPHTYQHFKMGSILDDVCIFDSSLLKYFIRLSNYERYRSQQLQICKKLSKNEWTISLTVWCSLLVSIKNLFFGIFWHQELYELKKEPNKRLLKFSTTSKMRFFDPLCHTLLFFL